MVSAVLGPHARRLRPEALHTRRCLTRKRSQTAERADLVRSPLPTQSWGLASETGPGAGAGGGSTGRCLAGPARGCVPTGGAGGAQTLTAAAGSGGVRGGGSQWPRPRPSAAPEPLPLGQHELGSVRTSLPVGQARLGPFVSGQLIGRIRYTPLPALRTGQLQRVSQGAVIGGSPLCCDASGIA